MKKERMHHVSKVDTSKGKGNESISTSMSVQGCDMGMSPTVQKFTIPKKKK